MVEQFNNLKGSKRHAEVPQTNRNVEITAPILDYDPTLSPRVTPRVTPERSKARSQSRSPEAAHKLWKTNPIFGSEEILDEDEDDMPEIIKRLSQNGLPSGKQLSDTLSSDMIVNSISNGE